MIATIAAIAKEKKIIAIAVTTIAEIEKVLFSAIVVAAIRWRVVSTSSLPSLNFFFFSTIAAIVEIIWKRGLTWKFLEVSCCIVQNNDKEMYQKSVLHVQSCFFC